MSSISPTLRRRFLSLFPVAAAGSFTASPAIAVAKADPFFVVWKRLDDARAAHAKADECYTAALNDPKADPAVVDALDEAYHAAVGAWYDAKDSARESRAHSPAGILKKLQFIEQAMVDREHISWDHFSMLQSAIRDLALLRS